MKMSLLRSRLPLSVAKFTAGELNFQVEGGIGSGDAMLMLANEKPGATDVDVDVVGASWILEG